MEDFFMKPHKAEQVLLAVGTPLGVIVFLLLGGKAILGGDVLIGILFLCGAVLFVGFGIGFSRWHRKLVRELSFDGENTIIETLYGTQILKTRNFFAVEDDGMRYLFRYRDGAEERLFVLEYRGAILRRKVDMEEIRAQMKCADFRKR